MQATYWDKQVSYTGELLRSLVSAVTGYWHFSKFPDKVPQLENIAQCATGHSVLAKSRKIQRLNVEIGRSRTHAVFTAIGRAGADIAR